MTAKQRANRERFKKVVAEAKKLRHKNPKLTQAQAVKQAWAISYTKQRAGKKLTGKAKPTERDILNKIHKVKKNVDKLWAGEFGIVLQTKQDLVQVLSPRGISGWMNASGIEILQIGRAHV